MKPFRSRNPIVLGAVSVVVIGLVTTGVFFAKDLPVIGGGTVYSADFGETAGLKPQDEVRISGLKVGEVTRVALVGDHVSVGFRVGGAWLGDKSSAAVKIRTLLGQKYLAIDPQGEAPLKASTPIPRERTFSPYDVTEAFSGLSTTIDQLDTKQLATSFQVLTEAFKDTPEQVRKALSGLSGLAKTISSRDGQLATLLANTAKISKTLADRNGQVEALLADGNLLLQEVGRRRDAIKSLLTGVRDLSAELSGLVADNSAQLAPALQQLDKLTDILQRNQDNLNKGLALAGPFYRLLNNPLGNGRWIDSYVCGLVPPVQADGNPAPGGPGATDTLGCVPPQPGGGR